jgi:hypothetical protein
MTNLPVPIPASEVPGNFITSALWNANVYNGLTFLLNPPLFIGQQAIAQSFANQTWSTVSFDTTIVDSYGGHSNTTNSSRYTAQVAGWYTVAGLFVTQGGSNNIRAARINVNGTAVVGTDGYSYPNGSSYETSAASAVRDVYLNVGDYVELGCWQGSGGALSGGINEIRSQLYIRFSHA